jgi:hypothetical protein
MRIWHSLNLKWDKRTLYNVLKFPFIVFVRIPIVLFFWGIEWINDWSEVITDKLPAWQIR